MLGLRALRVHAYRHDGDMLSWPYSLYYGRSWVNLQLEAQCSQPVKEHCCSLSPGELCGCGINTCTDIKLLARYVLVARRNIAVLIDTWGKIIVHQYGYRAQYAEIIAVIVNLREAATQLLRDTQGSLIAGLVHDRVEKNGLPFVLTAHDKMAKRAAEKWSLPIITLDTALQMIEVDDADR